MVGPGIGRGEYGGFLMSLPARRMYDVWGDPDYDFAENKAGAPADGGPRLLDSAVRGLRGGQTAAHASSALSPRRMGRTIVYIPIGQLSPVTLKKIRVVHVLDGYDKRDIAKQYLW